MLKYIIHINFLTSRLNYVNIYVMWEYTDKVRELFLHPKNTGEIKDADATGEVGSIVCGDALKLTLKIDKETNRIIDAKCPYGIDKRQDT